MSRADGYTLEADADLRALNTLALPCRARWLARLGTPDALPAVLQHAHALGCAVRVLGGGSNVVLPRSLEALVIQPGFGRWQFLPESPEQVLLVVEAGLPWDDVVRIAVDAGWRGIENLSLIPGQCGAAPIQNIGAYGVELADVLVWVEWVDLHTGRTYRERAEELQLGYRTSRFKQLPAGQALILRLALRLTRQRALRLDYAGIREELAALRCADPQVSDVRAAVIALRRRKLPDPRRLPNAGSFFQNPVVDAAHASALQAQHPGLPCWPQSDGRVKLSAAWLIDACGLRGTREGDAGVAEQHALVLVNHGSADAAEVCGLATRVQAAVRQRYAVEIHPEPQIWRGSND